MRKSFCAKEVACDACVDASPLSHACTAPDTHFLAAHAGDNFDPFIEDSHIDTYYSAMRDGGAMIDLLVADEQVLTIAGSAPGSIAHGSTNCLTTVTGSTIVDVLNNALRQVAAKTLDTQQIERRSTTPGYTVGPQQW